MAKSNIKANINIKALSTGINVTAKQNAISDELVSSDIKTPDLIINIST